MDAKELHKTWVIKSPLFKDEAKCEGCYQFKILDIVCDCKKVKVSLNCRSFTVRRIVDQKMNLTIWQNVNERIQMKKKLTPSN